MAGESPDKSEQRRSPGETAAGGRDPRLAAFGDAAPAGVDQPTAIFRAPKPPTDTVDGAVDGTDAAESGSVEPKSVKPSLVGQRQEAATVEPAKVPDEAADIPGSSGASGSSGLPGESGVSAVTDISGDSGSEAEVADENDADTQSERDDHTDSDSDDALRADAEADADAEPAVDADGTEGDAEVGAAEAGEPSASDDDSSGRSVTKTGPATGSGPVSASASDADAAPRSDSDPRPVDQPTAVFKAFGKRTDAAPAPAVDQPTTALKVPPADAAPPEPGGGKPAPRWATGAGADRDGDGERPGKFVPLRSDGVRTAAPATRTPAADGTAPAPAARGTEPAKASAATTTAAGSGTRTGSETRTAPAKGTGKAAGVGSGAGTAPGGDPEITAAVAPPSLAEAERTKQQPLPPRPPLDMLAELTNTPPPPETPLRTLVRRVKIWTPLVVLLLIVFATVQLLRPLPDPSLTLTAEPTYTFKGGELKMPWPTEGQGAVEVEGVGVVGTYGPQQPAPTASVAKAMTAYVILRDHPIKDKDAGPKLVIDQKTEDQASNPDWSTAPVKKGQEYTQGELLQLLMVRSANNVAHFLARWDAGSEEAFIKKMNAAAKDLGMTNTTYTDASGFDKGTVSTPKDQLKLAKAAMRFDAFRQIVDMPNVELPQIGRRLENGNTILLKDGVTGIKTGTSTPAGGNLLWSANTVVDGEVRRVLGVVMNVKSGVTLSDKTKLAVETYSYGLIKAAQDGVVSAVAVKKGDVVGYVDDGLGGRTPVVATEDLKPVGWAGLNVELKLTAGEDGKGGLPRTAAGGTVVGELAAGTGEGRVSVPVALQHQLEEPGFGAKLTRIG
ncbi:D-alanyl-D-alanine carboxypeptidase family protein [Streptomyces thermolilacinus]|uniref:Peptidase S11 D-alanyl-D-alanine carboxypeptidase A N-terminal domain-containing protein n=1 Tax=Streptomyces thermolilacinus SPC6 TaxID=1306406 RepID=A0A1D3DTY2_9ACTN|nr:D-alanyl-D-alanine carboxypeptidase [Streptomyces thermolilacinus]OEJ95786.1 hypothetical protein J116_016185 [Streptomyces thermolilacinus SPC6]